MTKHPSKLAGITLAHTGTQELALDQARAHLAVVGYGDQDALGQVRVAERELAAARGEQWAESIDIGAEWDSGAPLPHVLSNGSTAVLICRAHVTQTGGGGVSPGDKTASLFLEITFRSCWSVRFGGPNDETLEGHPLYGRGLEFYAAHKVHNSPWIRELDAIEASHGEYDVSAASTENHYLLSFHDETFEAVAETVEVRTVSGTLEELLSSAVSAIVSSPSH